MRTTLKNLILAGIAGLALSFFAHTAPVSAAATPESCFEFQKTGGVVTITGYYDNEANNSANPACSRDVEIPATIGGQAVESIVNSDGAYNFNGRSLTSLTIANGVKEVGGSYAFANNKLTSISLPPSIIYVGYSAFENNQLTSVSLNAGLESIGPDAFASNRLTSVTLPSTLKRLNEYAFAYNRISDISLPKGLIYTGYGGTMDWQGVAPDNFLDLNAFVGQSNSLNVRKIINTIEFNDEKMPIDCSIQDDKTVEMDNKTARQLCEYVKATDFWYVRVHTEDGNPNQYHDYADINGYFGINAGGHIINPTSTTYNFVDGSGKTLQPSVSRVGVASDGTALTDYYVKKGPALEGAWAEQNDIYSASMQAQHAALSVYHRVGDNTNYTAPVLNGVTATPASYSFVLSKNSSENTKTFVYKAANNTDETVSSGDNAGAKPDSGSLAATGTNAWMISVSAVALIGLGVVAGWKKLLG